MVVRAKRPYLVRAPAFAGETAGREKASQDCQIEVNPSRNAG